MKKLFIWALDRGKDQRVAILQKVGLFKGLRRRVLMKLLVDLVEKEYPPGEVIFSEGESGKALYIVLAGSVVISKRQNNSEKVLAELAAGSYFGELALIDHMPRYATAVAREKTTLLIMYKSYFDDLLQGNAAVSSKVLQNMVSLLSEYIRRKHHNETDERI